MIARGNRFNFSMKMKLSPYLSEINPYMVTCCRFASGGNIFRFVLGYVEDCSFKHFVDHLECIYALFFLIHLL